MKKLTVPSCKIFLFLKLKNYVLLALVGIFLLPLVGHAGDAAMVKTSSGLQYADLVVGQGREAWLLESSSPDSRKTI